MTESRATCLACGGTQCVVFLELAAVPVFCNVLHRDASSARLAARGDLRLAVCRTCGHVFNMAFDPARMEYTGAYENSLHHSPRFQQYAEQLAREMADTYALQGGHIVEVASGQGDFLRLLCTVAGCHGTGYDPSFRADQAMTITEGAEQARVLAEPFDERRLAQLRAEGVHPVLILCRQALEHFARPHDFLVDLGKVLPRDRRQPLFFEVPNVLYSLQAGGIWDFIYEHVSYFCSHSLAAAFKRSGYSVMATAPRFGGQFLSIEAVWPSGKDEDNAADRVVTECPQVPEIVDAARGLAATVQRRTQDWQDRLRALANNGEAVAIWGAGSKGVTFLNLVGETGVEVRLVDINPSKQGMYAAGTGIRIESPQELTTRPPALVIVMNPLYMDEIRADLQALGLEATCEGV